MRMWAKTKTERRQQNADDDADVVMTTFVAALPVLQFHRPQHYRGLQSTTQLLAPPRIMMMVMMTTLCQCTA